MGMGRQTAQSLPAAQRLFEEASDLLGYDLVQLCLEGPAEELHRTNRAQPALFVASLAALELLRSDTPEAFEKCEFAAGLSLGEYTALVFAGVIRFEDGLRLVQRRGDAMQAASDTSDGAMCSVLGLDEAQVESICDEARQSEVLEVANYLCPGNQVVSGHATACERVKPLAEAAGAFRVVDLTVAGAFHTRLMQPAVEPLGRALRQVDFQDGRIPVVSNVDAIGRTDAAEIVDVLERQVVQPVLWEETIRRLIHDGVDHFYEVGPGKVLRQLVKRTNRQVSCESVIG